VEIKAKYFLLEPKCGAWRQNGGRLGDVAEAGRPVLRGLEVILQILRLGGHLLVQLWGYRLVLRKISAFDRY